MTDYQIDPYKLNDVLQQILDKLALVESKSNSASPEFQVLMNNYLTKANEAERNQARFDEALERLDLAEQESKKFKIENQELIERIRSHERDFDSLRLDHQREINNIKDELNKIVQSKNDLEAVLSEKYSREFTLYKSEAERQMTQSQAEINDLLQTQKKLEDKLKIRSQEADNVEKELSDLKIKLADEQARIREEIIEATKRSHQIEQRFQDEREQMLKRIRELESSNEELNSAFTLKERELEYKDALLSQTLRQPPKTTFSNNNPKPIPQTRENTEEEQHSLTINKTASIMPIPKSEELIQENTEVQSPVQDSPKEKKVGGIWSKLN